MTIAGRSGGSACDRCFGFSPLIALSRIGRLDLLASLFERVLIPAEVHHEVTVDGRGLPGAEEVLSAGWIEVRAPHGPAEAAVE